MTSANMQLASLVLLRSCFSSVTAYAYAQLSSLLTLSSACHDHQIGTSLLTLAGSHYSWTLE